MKKLIAYFSVLVMLSGCSVTEDIPEGSHSDEIRYKAVMEGFCPETRTELDGNRILWSSEDMITVFDGSDTGKPYVLDPSCSGSSEGDFSAAPGSPADGSGDEVSAIIACYPHSTSLTLSGNPDGTLTLGNVTFPSQQKYVSSSIADGSFPMVSVTSEGDAGLHFRNLGGILHLRVKGKGNVTRVVLEGNAGELISGKSSVLLKEGALPVTVMDESASASVSIMCDPAVKLSENAAVDFYFSLPSVEFVSGFTATFEFGAKGTLVKQTSKAQRVERSSILHMPEFAFADMPGQCVDLGLSVKWAAWNVGASRPEQYGDYFAWGETKKKSSYTKTNHTHFDQSSNTYKDIGRNISGTKYDAAAVKWGNGWRMPTLEEINELAELCNWTDDSLGDVDGNFVTGPNGNSIFIPNTGYWQGTSKYFDNDHFEGHIGYFWSATLGPVKDEEAYIVNCELGHGVVAYRYWQRYFGLPVRPVKD